MASKKGNRKRKGGRRDGARERPPGESPDGAPPPLERLSPERLAQFLELALTPDELLRACRDAGAQPSGGYRLERKTASERARLLADAHKDKPQSRSGIELAVLRALQTPALRSLWLTPHAARELAQLVSGDPVSAEARLAWRCIGDGDPSLRQVAEVAIEHGMALLERYDDAAQSDAPPKAPPPPPPDVVELEKTLQRAERDRDALRAQLQQARAEIADRDNRLNEHKQEATRLRVEAAAHVAELSKYQALESTDERRMATELRKLSAERAHLETRLHDIEERLSAEKQRAATLERQLADRERPPLNLPPGESPHEEASAQDFTIPAFTDEFYKSLDGWDRRVVKVAFEKALLLAKDRRHPSLRAIGLVGCDNLFRVRVASDVRLIYRMGDDGRVEILSLIDREDLDRYVRQNRTRLDG